MPSCRKATAIALLVYVSGFSSQRIENSHLQRVGIATNKEAKRQGRESGEGQGHYSKNISQGAKAGLLEVSYLKVSGRRGKI